MSKMNIRFLSRVSFDPFDKRIIRSYFDPGGVPPETGLSPESIARRFIENNEDHLRFKLENLAGPSVKAGGDTRSMRFEQSFRGVPVYGAWVVINVHQGRSNVSSFFNNYCYKIPDDFPTKPRFSADEVVKIIEARKAEIAKKIARANPKAKATAKLSSPKLFVYFHRPSGKPVERSVVSDKVQAGKSVALQPDPKGEKIIRMIPTLQPETGCFYLVWQFFVEIKGVVRTSLEIFVDAHKGEIILARDRGRYVDGSGKVWGLGAGVFADPVRLTGNPALTTNTAGTVAPPATFDPLVRDETLPGLDPADASGHYALTGPYCKIQEIEDPVYAPPSENLSSFPYFPGDRNFLAVMAYYWIDKAQRFIQDELSIAGAADYQMPVDPQGKSGKLNAHFIPGAAHGAGQIAYGDGSNQTVPAGMQPGPPTASDAAVILHEYGHAIHDDQEYPPYEDLQSLWEGFSDLFAQIYLDRFNPSSVSRDEIFPWLNNAACGSPAGDYRRVDLAESYPSASPADWDSIEAYHQGDIWATTVWQIFLALGGASSYPEKRIWAANLVLRLYLQANTAFALTPGPPPYINHRNMAIALEDASHALGGWHSIADGLFHKVIRDRAIQRQLIDPLPVDVYIDDGRDGGYNYIEDFWNCEDIVVRRSAADTPSTPGFSYQEPIVDQPNYIWVRVKKRGDASPGSVKVKAFSCSPGTGLTWPTDWVAASPAFLPATSLDAAAEEWVGPFEFVPTELGHWCALAIVEAENDPANSETLVGSAPHWMLVPFDNNIAQRNLHPVSSGGGLWSRRRFRLINSLGRPAIARLEFIHDLPKGWRVDLDVPDSKAIPLPPYGERWVTMRLNIPEGHEIKNIAQRVRVTIRALIDGIPDGGMTFDFVSPEHPSLVPVGAGRPGRLPHDSCCACIREIFEGAEIEGEVKIDIKFKK